MLITAKDPQTGEVFRTNPLRDIVYFGPKLVEDVESRLSLTRLAAEDRARLLASSSGDELRAAFGSFALFFHHAIDPDLTTPLAALRASGFLVYAPVCQQLILEAFAKSVMGAFWDGIRSSVMEGEVPCTLAALQRRGRELLDDYQRGFLDAAHQSAQQSQSPCAPAGESVAALSAPPGL